MKRNSIFNSIPLLKPKRNTFNLSFENKITTDLFRLTPIFCKEALPDDVVTIRPEIFCRVSPMLSPIFHRMQIKTYFFFVPLRLLWDQFEAWINPKSGVSDIVPPKLEVPADTLASAYADGLGAKTLADYLGLNFGLSPEDYAKTGLDFANAVKVLFPKGFVVSSLPFRAYQQIYNDWFIDLNNVDVNEFSKDSGVETLDLAGFEPGDVPYNHPLYQSLLKIRYKSWEHDYFTSALPEPQRGEDVMAFDGADAIGDIDVSISGSGSQIVVGTGGVPASFDVSVGSSDSFPPDLATINRDWLIGNWQALGFDSQEAASTYATDSNIFAIRSSVVPDWDNLKTWAPGITYVPVTYVVDGRTIQGYGTQRTTTTGAVSASGIADKLSASASVSADSVPGVTVEELRIRMQMQSFLERNEVGGSRYTEMLYAHWGVKDPDGRLQRSEFIGGSKQPIQISDISSTVNNLDDDEPLGMYAGQGLSASAGRKIRYKVPEHGFIIGLTCICPRSGYSQGLHPLWSRFDRLDYYWPSFSHLGEQEVKNKEVLFTGFDSAEAAFGYQQRYAEYKTSNDECHGDMKGSLAHWHMSRMFKTPDDGDDIPKLSQNFTTPTIGDDDDLSRVWPVQNSGFEAANADHFVLDIYNHFYASRRMPKFATPRNGS